MEFLEEIVTGLKQKGWNVFDAGINATLSRIEHEGPVSKLEIGQTYYVLPVAQSMMDAVYKLKRHPAIEKEGVIYNLMRFSTTERGIELEDKEGVSRISYEELSNTVKKMQPA